MERMNHLPVNWVDGMKISKQQFLDLENSLLDSVRDANALALTDYNFGLLPAPEPGRDSLSIDVNSEWVELKYCRAVTRAGARIEIIDLDDSALRQSVRQLMGAFDFQQSQDWYVVVRVNPYERVPYGAPAPDTNPLRHLHAIPRYELGIIPREQTASTKIAAYAIPVAKIRGGIGGVELEKNYIPPCARLNSSTELIRIHQRLEQDLSYILDKAVLIVRKINYRRKRETLNPLATDIYLLASRTMEFITDNLDAYRLLIPHQPPILFIEQFMRLARTEQTALTLTQYKDYMLEYFRQYIRDFQYAVFDGAMQGLVSLVYNHFEIRQALDKVENLIGQLKVLFGSLEKLDYENLPTYDPVTRTQNWSNEPPQQPYAPPPQHEQRPPARTDIRINPNRPPGGVQGTGTGSQPGGPEERPDNPFGLKD